MLNSNATFAVLHKQCCSAVFKYHHLYLSLREWNFLPQNSPRGWFEPWSSDEHIFQIIWPQNLILYLQVVLVLLWHLRVWIPLNSDFTNLLFILVFFITPLFSLFSGTWAKTKIYSEYFLVVLFSENRLFDMSWVIQNILVLDQLRICGSRKYSDVALHVPPNLVARTYLVTVSKIYHRVHNRVTIGGGSLRPLAATSSQS